MIPKPPFAEDFSPEQEIAEFERLKPRLLDLWSALSAREEEPYTSVVIPSLTLDQAELSKIEAASFYEERLLFLLIRLRNPQAHMVYVTSQPIHPLVLEYYFQLLVGVPASHARGRLTLLCAYDASARSLTEKILARPRLIQRIRYGIPDPSRAFLTVFNSTPLERKLAVLLGIPLNGVDPALAPLGTKSGSRKVFREAGVPHPEGFEDLHSADDIVNALDELRKRRPGIRRAVLKLDSSFSGEGNAIFRYPKTPWRGAIRDALANLTFSVRTEPDRYRRKFAERGGVVEEYLDYPESASPSAQLRIDPQGEAVLLSTHDQILGGPSSQVYMGCRFPAAEPYRRSIQDAARRVGELLARRGVVSRFGVDFFVGRRSGWRRLGALCPRDQPPGRRNHAPVPGASVSDRRPARSGDGRFSVAGRLVEVLPLDRQREVGGVRRPLSGGPDRHHDGQPPAVQPRHRNGRPVPHDRGSVPVRKARPHGDR